MGGNLLGDNFDDKKFFTSDYCDLQELNKRE